MYNKGIKCQKFIWKRNNSNQYNAFTVTFDKLNASLLINLFQNKKWLTPNMYIKYIVYFPPENWALADLPFSSRLTGLL